MRTRSRLHRNAGFTLVEIAIVLVIIGLLLGGILKGQEMITQARAKAIANDFNGITAAFFSYQDRYRALPGDDPGAATRWPAGGPLAQPAGNCTAIIEGAYADATGTANSETWLFWGHLRAAGFVPGPTTGPLSTVQPTNPVAGIIGVQSGAAGIGGPVICTTNIPDKIAISLDTLMDDGAPNSGAVRAFAAAGNVAIANVAPAIAGNAFVETGPGGGTLFQMCRGLL
jgi:prepilin-type N-terminal cleavage/methylation domain-containing protein